MERQLVLFAYGLLVGHALFAIRGTLEVLFNRRSTYASMAGFNLGFVFMVTILIMVYPRWSGNAVFWLFVCSFLVMLASKRRRPASL